MKFSYKFTNLLGTVYNEGNLVFTPDGNSLISPVGNRLTIYDLKNNETRTLSLESRYNYTNIALSPDGALLIAVNSIGEAHLITMITCSVIQRHKFQDRVQYIVFSPNGNHFAVAKGSTVLVFKTPGKFTGEYKSFVLEKHFLAGYDDITCLDWSSDSRFLAVGCRDNSTKICALRFMNNFREYNLCGHGNAIVACFFESNSLHINTISANGQLCLWECSLGLADINEVVKEKHTTAISAKQKKKEITDESDDDVSVNNVEDSKVKLSTIDSNGATAVQSHPFFYKKLARHYLADEVRNNDRNTILSAAHYNRNQNILIVGFSNGAFYLYEMPELNLIHSLSILNYQISCALFNCTGDWLALASKNLGQLLVWEWRSEQYIMKQQGHQKDMTCVSYSADGQYVATGGEDAKVKLWNVQTGFCFVTFTEHTSSVTSVKFTKKKFLLSSSLDGTVRAFDLVRYRNFRTFTSPRVVQFSCVDIDSSGELVAAGGHDVFEIYLWSMKLGKLLEIISGHEGPVCTVSFSPVATASTLVSGSWDKTTRIWNCLESNSTHEILELLYDVTCIAFDPSGKQVAVATLNGNITTFNIQTGTQESTIEGRYDLNYGQFEKDIRSAESNLNGRYFASLDYSVDGECILAGGKSPFICIYHARESVLLKKILISQNYSFDEFCQFMGHRKITDFGSIALIDQRSARYDTSDMDLPLPGTNKHDASLRNLKPEVRVFAVKYSSSTKSFIIACTEGLCVYSLDNNVVYDPLYLSHEITPKAIKDSLKEQQYLTALIMALKIDDSALIAMTMEIIPYKDIQLIAPSLSVEFTHRLLERMTTTLKTTPHIEFYLEWICCLLGHHGNKDNIFVSHALLHLHETIVYKYEMINKICDFNKYTTALIVDTEKNISNAMTVLNSNAQEYTA